MREIKFRIPNFKFSDDSFSHFSYWGRIDQFGKYNKNVFTSPSYNNKTYAGEDEQFTNFKDNQLIDIYENDKCSVDLANGTKKIAIVRFIDGCFSLEFEYKNKKRYDYLKCYTINHAVRIIGSIHEFFEERKK